MQATRPHELEISHEIEAKEARGGIEKMATVSSQYRNDDDDDDDDGTRH